MLKKTLLTICMVLLSVLGYAALSEVFHFSAQSSFVQPQTSPTVYAKQSIQTWQQAGFVVVDGDVNAQHEQWSLRHHSMDEAAVLYVTRQILSATECHHTDVWGQTRREKINQHVWLHHQQDAQSRLAPSLSVGIESVCWWIEGNSGLSEAEDTALKWRLAQLLVPKP